MTDAQTRWEDKRASDCAEHNQPKCKHFPDHYCDECHDSHRLWGEFNAFCLLCQEERCEACNGTGTVKFKGKVPIRAEIHLGDLDEDCRNCDGTGRIDI